MSIGKRRGGSGNPLLKFDARNGSFYRVDRNTNGEVEQTTIVDFNATFDLANLEVGWIRFDAGSAPSFKMVQAGQDIGNPAAQKCCGWEHGDCAKTLTQTASQPQSRKICITSFFTTSATWNLSLALSSSGNGSHPYVFKLTKFIGKVASQFLSLVQQCHFFRPT